MDAELNSENSSAAGETAGQSQVCESSLARRLGSEAATPAAAADAASGEGSLATGARDEGQAKAVIAQLVEPAGRAEKISSAGETGRDNHVGALQVGASSVAIASSDAAAVVPLGDALAALDRRDYATARRLFEALGRKDAAEAIRDALAALDRKDYATAQGLFEALSLKGAASAQMKGQYNSVISPVEVIPSVDPAYRRPLPQAERTRARGLKPLLLGTGLVLIAIFGASAIYGSPLNWTFATAKSQAIAGLTSAVAGLTSTADVLKARLEAITGPSAREEERMRDLSAALTQVTIRLDQIEHDYGARLDKLGERMDQDPSSRLADFAARLDKLEKKAAVAATPASEFGDVVVRLDRLEKRVAVAAAPSSEFGDTRRNELEKRAAVPDASSAKPLPPERPKPSTLTARAEPSPSNEPTRPDTPRPVLQGYSVEYAHDGIALVDGRFGPREVAPGDFIPGAGRVLRIERRGGGWVVVTSRGVISSGPAPE